MPTPETAMTAAYDSSAYGAGGLPYAPQPGIGFNVSTSPVLDVCIIQIK